MSTDASGPATAPVKVSGGSLPQETALSDLKKTGENVGEEIAQAFIADFEAAIVSGPMHNKLPVPDINEKLSGSFKIPVTNAVYNYTLEFDGKALIFNATPAS